MSASHSQPRPSPTPLTNTNANPILSSSPAFATPAHPILSKAPTQAPRVSAPKDSATFARHPPRPASVLPILLPPQTLRPIAFRTFTKKHNLTLTASSLSALATFIGRHCGNGWREEGLAEGVLEEVARQWKKGEGGVIVDAEKDNGRLKEILRTIEGGMAGGKVNGGSVSSLSRESSSIGGGALERMISEGRPNAQRNESQDSLGMSALDMEEEGDEGDGSKEVRGWLKTIHAFEQPQLIFNATRKHFERSKTKPSLLPGPSAKTIAFRQRYHIFHQRILRNESFQTPTTTSTSGVQRQWRITSVANLLGRGGSRHVLLGMLAITPTGTLALNDLTGSIQLDLDQANHIDDVETWICPGMIVLVEGVYEEDYGNTGGGLAGQGGVGGTLGGKFIGFSIGAPKAEPRAQSLGISDAANGSDHGHLASGFGWVDFLGVGSERAVGSRMRRLEQRLLTMPMLSHNATLAATPNLTTAAGRLVILGHVTLDQPRTLSALRKLFDAYTASATHLTSNPTEGVTPASTLPTGFVLFGPFTSLPALSTPSTTLDTGAPNSRAYKNAFDALAALLSDYPILLRHCTFHFVPSDNDAWPSAFSAGGAIPLPRNSVPDLFTTRVRRAFATANGDSASRAKELRGAGEQAHESVPGEAVWTSNPARLSLFGPNCEIVLFRDDATGRLRRNSVAFGKNRRVEEQELDSDADSGVVMMSGARTAAEGSDSQRQEGEGDGDVMDIDAQPHLLSPTPQPEPAPKQPPIDPTTAHARRLTKTLLDQSHLCPYTPNVRPVHWAHAHSLSLYPLPSAVVLCDADAPAFSIVYQGCAVLNAGKLVSPLGNGRSREGVRWCEFSLVERRGAVRTLSL